MAQIFLHYDGKPNTGQAAGLPLHLEDFAD